MKINKKKLASSICGLTMLFGASGARQKTFAKANLSKIASVSCNVISGLSLVGAVASFGGAAYCASDVSELRKQVEIDEQEFEQSNDKSFSNHALHVGNAIFHDVPGEFVLKLLVMGCLICGTGLALTSAVSAGTGYLISKFSNKSGNNAKNSDKIEANKNNKNSNEIKNQT